jgi:hypothetical protein
MGAAIRHAQCDPRFKIATTNNFRMPSDVLLVAR